MLKLHTKEKIALRFLEECTIRNSFLIILPLYSNLGNFEPSMLLLQKFSNLRLKIPPKNNKLTYNLQIYYYLFFTLKH